MCVCARKVHTHVYVQMCVQSAHTYVYVHMCVYTHTKRNHFAGHLKLTGHCTPTVCVLSCSVMSESL